MTLLKKNFKIDSIFVINLVFAFFPISFILGNFATNTCQNTSLSSKCTSNLPNIANLSTSETFKVLIFLQKVGEPIVTITAAMSELSLAAQSRPNTCFSCE